MSDLIFARAQERITCEQGHLICTMARTVLIGEPIDPSRDFKHWQQTPPVVGQEGNTVRCSRCRGWWTESGRFHFEDGWR